jgi:hypothetical protein
MRSLWTQTRNGLLALAASATLLSGAGLSHAASVNHCGCRQAEGGACICEKKAKCGCPGECEPKGCEQQREKAFQKQVDAETKRAEAAGHNRRTLRDKESKESAAPAPPRRKLTEAQAKQLVKLLDLYFSEHPDAKGGTAGGLRDSVARAH